MNGLYFQFLGHHEGQWLFAMDTRGKKGITVLEMENRVTEWLLNDSAGKFWTGNGNDVRNSIPQVDKTGFTFYVLLSSLRDVVTFGQDFPVTNLTLENLYSVT